MKTFRNVMLYSALFLVSCAPLALAQGTYTQIVYPGATQTYLFGINTAGDIVGYYAGSSGGYHGFLLSGGVYTTIDFPGAHNTYLYGINDLGQIVGNITANGREGSVGFRYDMQAQQFTVIPSPVGALFSAPLAINNAGTIVGEFQVPGSSNGTGFELVGDQYRRIVPRGASNSECDGINDSGEIVGWAADKHGKGMNFLFAEGQFRNTGVPKSEYTFGINDQGTIVGMYATPSGFNAGFLYQDGIFQSLSFPGAVETIARAVNNSNVVVGYTYPLGFMWTPPTDTPKK